MNKRQIIASLNNIANTLDNSGLYKEANTITNVMKKLAQEQNLDNPPFDIPDDSEQKRRDNIHNELTELTNGHSALMVVVDLYNEIENMMSQIIDPKAIDILATKEINQGDTYFDSYYRQMIDAIIGSVEDSSLQTKMLISFLERVSKTMNIFRKINYNLFLVRMMNMVVDFEMWMRNKNMREQNEQN